ncbi:hypothetical protein E4U21_007602 [Claviceps maximensis]|nr:hypothetical protein E4U21_007602 [Claviceps maximensis]
MGSCLKQLSPPTVRQDSASDSSSSLVRLASRVARVITLHSLLIWTRDSVQGAIPSIPPSYGFLHGPEDSHVVTCSLNHLKHIVTSHSALTAHHVDLQEQQGRSACWSSRTWAQPNAVSGLGATADEIRDGHMAKICGGET